jgi:hypothetical protein
MKSKVVLVLVWLLSGIVSAGAMSASSVPPKFPIPFASTAGAPAYINYPIPTPSQIGITNCLASLTTGFPPLTFTPAAGGGCAPFGQDFNGIFKQITLWNQWQSAGAPIFYDSGFSSAIGGYPKGAVLWNAATVGCFWESEVDNNTSNPDAAGANWLGYCPNVLTVGQPTSGGAAGRVFYDTGTVVGEYTVTGTAGSVVLSTSPTIASPTLTGTVAGGATYTGPTITNPTITGTISGAPSMAVGGSLSGALPNPSIAPSGVAAGSYVATAITVGADGRITAAANAAYPTYTTLTSAGTGTYTTPAGAKRLVVWMVGAGGAGGGTSTGGNGSQSVFGTTTAQPGRGGGAAGSSCSLGSTGTGGTGGATGTGTQVDRVAGGGGASSGTTAGAPGGATVYGGTGLGNPSGAGGAAVQSSGAGGGGESTGGANGGGCGGGAGEYVLFVVNNPASSYTYTVGTGGTVTSGGPGSNGKIVVQEEYY